MSTLLSDVRTQIKSDLIITGSDYDSQIDNAIRSALRQLRTRKFWFLEKSANLALSSGFSSLTLPTDFGAAGMFDIIVGGTRFTHGTGFDFLSYEDLRKTYWTTDPLTTSQPIACAVSNGSLYFDCIADAAYTVPTIYYQKDATLPQAGDTSIWFDDGYDVVESLASMIFKRASQQYTLSEEDGSIAALYMQALQRQHERYEGSR